MQFDRSARRYSMEGTTMVETILKVDGMMCGMCESHINDVVRKTARVNKVTSSHTKGETDRVRAGKSLSEPRFCEHPQREQPPQLHDPGGRHDAMEGAGKQRCFP